MYTSPYLSHISVKLLFLSEPQKSQTAMCTSSYLSHRRAKPLCIPPLIWAAEEPNNCIPPFIWATEEPNSYVYLRLPEPQKSQPCIPPLIWDVEEPNSYVYLTLSEPQKSHTAMYTSPYLSHRGAKQLCIPPLIWATEEPNSYVYLSSDPQKSQICIHPPYLGCRRAK